MRYSRHGLLHPRDEVRFNDSLRDVLPTVASPPSFAPPVDVRDSEEAFVIVFDISRSGECSLSIQTLDQRLVLYARRNDGSANRAEPFRVYSLPFQTVSRKVEALASGGLLTVIVYKRERRKTGLPMSRV